MSLSRLSLVSLLCLICVFAGGLTGCGAGLSRGSGGSGGSGPTPTVTLQSSATTINAGQSATLTWTSTNATSVSITPAVGSGTLDLSGTATVSPTQTTTYTITATASGGQTSTSSVTVTVNSSSGPPTVTLTAGSATIDNGAPDTLTWTTTNATSVTISPTIDVEDVGTLPVNYTAPVSPLQTTTYTITATGPGGTATASTTITVNQLPPTVTLTLDPTTIVAGQTSTLTWSTGHASALTIVDSNNQPIAVTSPASGSVTVKPSTTTTYTATVTGYANSGAAPTATATATLTISALTATLTANPASLPGAGSTTLSYSVTTDPGQTVTVTIDNGALSSSTNASGTVSVNLSAATTYTLTATQADGLTTTAKATVTVGSALDSNIKHIFFLVQENRSFDNYFSKLGVYRANDPFSGQSYGATGDVDGITDDNDPQFTIHDHSGAALKPFHQKTVCIDDLSPAWDESHVDINLQSGTYKMDGFANGTAATYGGSNDPNGRRVSGYYDWTDLPYYYELATQYATSDRWFAPELANTVPNRMYLFAGTSYGTTYPQVPAPGSFQRPVIFDTLVKNGVSWTYYTQDGNAFLGYYNNPDNPNFSQDGLGNHYQAISSLLTTLADPNADKMLPSVIYIEKGASKDGGDEHPGDGNMQKGAANTASIVNAFINSPAYADSILIVTWDEPGGLYDHVAPQAMPAPDDVSPSLQSPDNGKTGVIKGDFKTTGMRIPLIVISPWVKPHFVSHTVRDSTAILKLIETRFGLPSLTARDAAQDDMTEFFDFSQPALLTPPKLPAQPTNGTCNASLEAR